MTRATRLFIALQVADVLTTLAGIYLLNASEINPAIRALFNLIGIIPALILIKLAIACPMLAFLRNRPARMLTLANTVFSGVIAWNLLTITRALVQHAV